MAGMMERTIYSPDPKHLGELKDREGVELFRDLLWCDAVRLSLRNITISLNTTDADGGIDAKADREQSSDAGVVSGSFHSRSPMDVHATETVLAAVVLCLVRVQWAYYKKHL